MVSVDIQDMFQEKVSNKASGQRFTPQTQRAHSFEDRHRKKIREKKKKSKEARGGEDPRDNFSDYNSVLNSKFLSKRE